MNHEENSRETALSALDEKLTICAKYRFKVTSQDDRVVTAAARDVEETWPIDGSFVVIYGKKDNLEIFHSTAGADIVKTAFKHGYYISLFKYPPLDYILQQREFVLYMIVPGHDDAIRQWLLETQTAFDNQQILQPIDPLGFGIS